MLAFVISWRRPELEPLRVSLSRSTSCLRVGEALEFRAWRPHARASRGDADSAKACLLVPVFSLVADPQAGSTRRVDDRVPYRYTVLPCSFAYFATAAARFHGARLQIANIGSCRERREYQFARGGSSHWPASAPDGNEVQVPERS